MRYRFKSSWFTVVLVFLLLLFSWLLVDVLAEYLPVLSVGVSRCRWNDNHHIQMVLSLSLCFLAVSVSLLANYRNSFCCMPSRSFGLSLSLLSPSLSSALFRSSFFGFVQTLKDTYLAIKWLSNITLKQNSHTHMSYVLAHIKFTSHDSGPLIVYDRFALVYDTRKCLWKKPNQTTSKRKKLLLFPTLLPFRFNFSYRISISQSLLLLRPKQCKTEYQTLRLMGWCLSDTFASGHNPFSVWLFIFA